MSWYKTEGGTADCKPPVIDNTSSKKVVYVRKNFNLETREIDGESSYQIWTYMEQVIPKDDWDTYQSIMQNTSDISDLMDAIVELAGIITEE